MGSFAREETISLVKKSFESSEDIETVVGAVPITCPLSTELPKLPVRGENCDHFHCFDAQYFLSYSLKTGKLSCPISACKKKISPDKLKVDLYMREIIQECKSAGVVVFKKDGSWENKSERDLRVDSDFGENKKRDLIDLALTAADNDRYPSKKQRIFLDLTNDCE